jgi:putative endopeptidase
MGWVIGHEISHGFDFGGSQWDAYGTGNSILAEDDPQDFVEIADKLVAYYDGFEPAPGIHLDGNDVKIEAIADLCGMQLCLELASEKENFDYEEFFEKTEEIWCTVFVSEYYLRYLIAMDTHPLNNLRGNVNQQMFDEFYDTYDVKEGDGMYLPEEERIQFWGEGA